MTFRSSCATNTTIQLIGLYRNGREEAVGDHPPQSYLPLYTESKRPR